MESFGLKADISNNGLEAIMTLKEADKSPYTLVLMDCQMPQMDGYEASTSIRAGEAGSDNKVVPIIAMTANAMEGDKEKCIAAGMDDYISKPIDVNVLKNLLKKWLLDKAVESDVESVDDRVSETVVQCWDEAEALKRFGGSDKMLRKIMRVFLEDIVTQLQQLKEAVDNEDITNSKLYAHSIKGSAANLSALKLQAMGRSMESAAENAQLEILKKEYIHVKEAVDEIIEQFNSYLYKD